MPSFTEQWEILRRGVDAVIPEDDFRKMLDRSIATNVPLRVKYGIDPTGIDVHLGHTVPLRKLRQFQELGHTAVLIIGNYTALVGDPSGRDETRATLTESQVEANAKDYLKQVGRIIDLSRAEIHHNGDWFSKWSFLDVLRLMRRTTIGQISAREDFAKRLKEAKPVHLSECLYPLMQGWDSVEVKADVELGGTEQLFNLLVARDLQQEEAQRPQVAMTMPILVGTDGARRMGKSLGNYIGVAETADSQFGKVMSLPDEPMRPYFTLLTDVPLAEVDRLLGPEVNPRNAKEVLGRAIVAQYHGLEAADAAAMAFRRRSAGLDPENIPEVVISRRHLDERGEMNVVRLLMALGLEVTNTAARRSIEQRNVSVGTDRRVLSSVDDRLLVEEGLIVRDTKRKIARVRFGQPEWIYCGTDGGKDGGVGLDQTAQLFREWGAIWCPTDFQGWPGDPAPGDPLWLCWKHKDGRGGINLIGRGRIEYSRKEGRLSNLYSTNTDLPGVREAARALNYKGPDAMRFLWVSGAVTNPSPPVAFADPTVLPANLSRASDTLLERLHAIVGP